jgi:hypothetical protein
VLVKRPQPALRRDELREAIFQTPYERMPYRKYWEKLERAYRVGNMPFKAEREARLAEIRSARLITLNYCPMNCTFCSSTNFLHAAQDGTALLARLDAQECVAMVRRVVAAVPGVRTIIFQDDIFAFPTDHRILPLCEALRAAKAEGDLPKGLQFISTNRIDAMTPERLRALRAAGFRVLGFGVESFSLPVLREFGKARIHPLVESVLATALASGITPFLDVILTSPRSTLADLAETIRDVYRWTLKGCECGMYPYVIPFAGAAMAADVTLRPFTVSRRHHIEGTDIEWEQPSKILPIDPELRGAILAIESRFEARLSGLERGEAHLPSRVRSLLWTACAIPVLREAGEDTPELEGVEAALAARAGGSADGSLESAAVES